MQQKCHSHHIQNIQLQNLQKFILVNNNREVFEAVLSGTDSQMVSRKPSFYIHAR